MNLSVFNESNQSFDYFMMTNCVQKSFTLQNSLSTVSLGKLGEDGGEEGLDVEEE